MARRIPILDTYTRDGYTTLSQEFIVQHHHNHSHSVAEAPSPVVEVDIRSAYNGTEYAGFEQDLHQLPGVTGAHLDRTRGVALDMRGLRPPQRPRRTPNIRKRQEPPLRAAPRWGTASTLVTGLRWSPTCGGASSSQLCCRCR